MGNKDLEYYSYSSTSPTCFYYINRLSKSMDNYSCGAVECCHIYNSWILNRPELLACIYIYNNTYQAWATVNRSISLANDIIYLCCIKLKFRCYTYLSSSCTEIIYDSVIEYYSSSGANCSIVNDSASCKIASQDSVRCVRVDIGIIDCYNCGVASTSLSRFGRPPIMIGKST